MDLYKGLALFAGGALFGSAGVRLLSSRDAKKIYTHTTAAVLRMQDSVMETVTCVQENAADILAAAREINEQRTQTEDISETDCEAENGSCTQTEDAAQTDCAGQ